MTVVRAATEHRLGNRTGAGNGHDLLRAIATATRRGWRSPILPSCWEQRYWINLIFGRNRLIRRPCPLRLFREQRAALAFLLLDFLQGVFDVAALLFQRGAMLFQYA